MLRLKILFVFFILFFFLIIIKLGYIQILESNKYQKNLYLKTEQILPHRGFIFDRNKEPLVVNETRYQLFFEPEKITDKKSFIQKIRYVLDIDEATLSAKLFSGKKWVRIKNNLSTDEKKSLQNLKLKGLGFLEEEVRYYPEGSIAAHLLGFVGKDERGDSVGYFGIEGYYDNDLRGLPGLIKSERDVIGMPILVGVQEVIKGENGRNIILTIDKNVQAFVKKHLIKGLETYQAEKGCIIIMEPFTGEIIALSCLPDFDPKNYFKFSEEYFKNSAISETFEPGSIFKPLMMAAALNENKVEAVDTFIEEGPVQVGGYFISNWDDKYQGEISMTNIIEKSSNVGMVYVGKKLGKKQILRYIKLYGFGQKTGIDLQGEVAGIIKEEKSWYPIDYATVMFGQGIAVTQIQMIRAFSALVNGGYLVKPFIVKSLISEDGKEKKIYPQKIKKIISKKTSIIINNMLQKAVAHGEVKWDIPKGYLIGGKTGTAQIPIKGHYDPNKTIASYIGYAPASRPKFVIMVSLFKPKTSQWGSETAAPIFFNLLRDLLLYYNIPKNK